MRNLLQPAGIVAFWIMVLGVGARGQGNVAVPPELVSYPDLIIYNGKIVTMDDPSLNNSPGRTVEAMAVRGDRIQFLGSDAEVLRYAGPQTRTIDLELIAPEEAVDRVTVMKMATTWASHYVLKEDELGSLEPGKLPTLLSTTKTSSQSRRKRFRPFIR